MFNAAICLIFFSGIFLTNYTQLICVKVKNVKCFPHDYASSIFFSFNGQGQLSSHTCAEWRDLSNHTRMSTIQSRTPEKEAKNHVTRTWKSPWKSCSITHLPFLSPNPKILKAFPKTLPTKTKPTKCPAREKKNEARKAKKEGRRESEK